MKVILKPGREKALYNRHPWIFSGAIDTRPNPCSGEIMPVYSSKGDLLGHAFLNSKSQLIGRVVSFGNEDPYDAIKRHLEEALRARQFNNQTSAYRLVNGEGDFLPGLIIDQYDDLAVMQIGCLGMEKLKPFILQHLPFDHVYEKSDLPSRREEGLLPFEGWLKGKKDNLVIKENGLKFKVSLEGQKTGFFLDQREMRELIRRLAKEKRVLNTFAYSGGFSIAALAGGAKEVVSVDISEPAVKLIGENIRLNGFPEQKNIVADVFEFLRQESLDYDIVILDPPAFAKKAKDVVQACRGYKDINRLAMSKMPKGSLLLTCSCSHHVDEKLFQQVVFQASIEAQREVQILSRHHLAMDHPINVACPEGEYLKSFLLRVL